MELLYVWIEEFRNIKKQGFDFSGQFEFKVEEIESDKSEKDITYQLHISLNENYINLFEDNIMNVTGIVGKNGSGKSNLLHCLKLMAGDLNRLNCPLVFCLYKKENKTISTYYYNGGDFKNSTPLNVKIKANDNMNEKYKVNSAKPYTLDRNNKNGNRVLGLDFEFTSIAACFYSNTFDSHLEKDYECIHNVSTNYRLESFLIEYIANKEIQNTTIEGYNAPWVSHLRAYHNLELRSLIEFLSYANKLNDKNLKFLPKILIVEFKFEDYHFLINDKGFFSELNIVDIKELYKKVIDVTNKSNDSTYNFLLLMILSCIFSILRKFSNQSTLLIAFNYFKLIRKKEIDSNNLLDLLISLIRKYLDNSVSKEIELKFIDNLGLDFKKLDFNSLDIENPVKTKFYIKIKEGLWDIMDQIFKLQLLSVSPIINFSWLGGLSSGQQAFLTHFARLYDLRKSFGSNPIWLFIDEGDLYFHPQWQKEYFSHLLDYVKFLFPKNKVQIIITTHSPFIASDLPKQNLIFLKQEKNGNCQIVNHEIKMQTFGGNIHSLFSDSFFIEGALMGDFAKNQINDIIKFLNDETSVKNNDIKKKIELIGEPVLKRKLEEMWFDKFGIEEEISELEKRIIELKSKKK